MKYLIGDRRNYHLAEKGYFDMNIKVKIKHDARHCRNCSEMAELCNSIPSCSNCEMKDGVWVDTVKSIFETNAIIVMENGDIVSLPISRIVGVDVSELGITESN